MGFATLLRIFRTVIVDVGIKDDDNTKMARYAISQWRTRGIVVDVKIGYLTRKF
jgi:hypothetical protein